MNTIYDGSFVLGDTNNLTFEAGPGITIDSPSAGTVRIGNDETVLFSGAPYPATGYFPAVTASGSIFDYNKVEITLDCCTGKNCPVTQTWWTDDLRNKIVTFVQHGYNGSTALNKVYPHTISYTINDEGTVFSPYYQGYHLQSYGSDSTGAAGQTVTLTNGRFNVTASSTLEYAIRRIIGIGSKSNA